MDAVSSNGLIAIGRSNRMGSFLRRHRYRLVSVLSSVSFLALWDLLVRIDLIDGAFLPGPTQVVGEFVRLLADGSLLNDIWASTQRVLIGFALAAIGGVPLGVLLGDVKIVRWIVQPIVAIIRPLPSLAWIPLSLLWLGIGETQKYAIVFMGTLAPLVVFVAEATSRVDPLYVRAAQNLGASRAALLWEVMFPAILPSIISALKVVLALAWTCIISAEMVGSNDGLGYLIWNAKDWSNAGQVIVGMLAISGVVLALDSVLRMIERRLIPWEHIVDR